MTKIIPLPPGPSIVPLQRAEPTLGNPLKCLFGPVAGDLHLTDMMRKGKPVAPVLIVSSGFEYS